MPSALVSPLSDRICIEMCSLTIDDVDSGRLNDRYRATCGKTMASENNGTASRSVYEALKSARNWRSQIPDHRRFVQKWETRQRETRRSGSAPK